MDVSWTQTPGSDNYTAWAIGTDGHRRSCNSTSDSCSIHDLQCGEVYEVAVTSSAMGCDIIAGSDYKLHSGQSRSSCENRIIRFVMCQGGNWNCNFLFLQLPVNLRTPLSSKTAAAPA